MSIIDDRRKALLERVRDYGGPLNEPAVFVQFMAQVMHESGGLKDVRERWGPTKAQRGYEGREDLGNVKPGDGAKFRGRDVIQVTGRTNYRLLTAWVRKTFGKGPDFEAKPETLELPEWLGIGAIWFFLTRKDLLRYAREGNNEMVTRVVNGGLNGYQDRLRWYDDAALKVLGFMDVKSFQGAWGLVVDGISGPKTRAAMHKALTGVKVAQVTETPKTEHVPPVVSPKPAKPNTTKPAPTLSIGRFIGALLVASGAWLVTKWNDFWMGVADAIQSIIN